MMLVHSQRPVDNRDETPQIATDMRYPKPYYDACKLQDRIMQVLDSVQTKELANVCKGYATLEMLKLRLRMKPAPKPIDVSGDQKPRKPKRTVGTFSES